MNWFRSPPSLPSLPTPSQWIPIEKNGSYQRIPALEFEKMTGARFIPQLDFESALLLTRLIRQSKKLYAAGEFSRKQLWLGSYFCQEVLSFPIPDVTLRYIDSSLGWGVFAARDFKEMEFISEYAGKVRKRRWSDKKNAYCFEYLVASGHSTSYVIDACGQGGIGRYINHSFTPNLISALVTIDHVSHVILVTHQRIPKGTQLSFDYGATYWKDRLAPRTI